MRYAWIVAVVAWYPAFFSQGGEAPTYEDHEDLLCFRNEKGDRQRVTTTEQWQNRKKHILEHMRRVMGEVPGKNARVPLDVKIDEATDLDGFQRRKLSFQSDSHGRVPAYLFVPVKQGKYAAILCLHQTTPHGKAEPAGLAGNGNMHYALELATRGFVVLAPDYPSLGGHAWDFHPKRGYASGSMKAVWDNIRAVDLLQSMAEVDPDRIGVIGHSLGGHSAMFTAAFEPRLKAIVSSCGFTRFARDDMPSWTGPRYMPRIAQVYKNDAARVPFDFPEIIGTFAPRAFLACAAEKDSDFNVTGVRESIAAAAKVYALYGASENLQAHYPKTGHDFPPEAREIAYRFLEKHLR